MIWEDKEVKERSLREGVNPIKNDQVEVVNNSLTMLFISFQFHQYIDDLIDINVHSRNEEHNYGSPEGVSFYCIGSNWWSSFDSLMDTM